MKTSSLFSRVAILLAGLLIPGSAFAQTLTVQTTADDGSSNSLRTLLSAAVDGDTIDFAPNVTGVITLTQGELQIGRNLTIIGPSPNVLTISGGLLNGRLFNILYTNTTVSISGLGMFGGSAVGAGDGGDGQGGGIINNGNLTLTTCTIFLNVAIGGIADEPGYAGSGEGGAIYSSGTLTLVNCTVQANSAIGVEATYAPERARLFS